MRCWDWDGFGMCGGGRQPYPVLDALLSFHLSTWKRSDQLMIGTSTFSLPPFSKLVDTPRVYKKQFIIDESIIIKKIKIQLLLYIVTKSSGHARRASFLEHNTQT
jgi:hypothetical protein